MAATIEAIARMDIPVMGHVGLTPQSVHRMGGHKVQGRRHGKAARRPRARARRCARGRGGGRLRRRARGHPARSRRRDHRRARPFPTIGIGAGVHCDGQVLVLHDLLGLSARAPKFAKAYAALADEVTTRRRGVRARGEERRAFPTDAHSVSTRSSRWRRTAERGAMEIITRSPGHAGLGRRRARRRAGASRSCPPWARCTRATSSWCGRRDARAERVVVSIFVNPMQFNRRDDFERYPRALDEDVAHAARRPASTSSTRRRPAPCTPRASPRASRSPASRSRSAAAARPGHFRGVTTVVTKLFHAVRPARGGVRREGLAAAGGDPPHDRRPRLRHRDRRRADGARGRRPGAVEPQPAARRRGTGGAARCVPRALDAAAAAVAARRDRRRGRSSTAPRQ